jgi:hypothetical protein
MTSAKRMACLGFMLAFFVKELGEAMVHSSTATRRMQCDGWKQPSLERNVTAVLSNRAPFRRCAAGAMRRKKRVGAMRGNSTTTPRGGRGEPDIGHRLVRLGDKNSGGE